MEIGQKKRVHKNRILVIIQRYIPNDISTLATHIRLREAIRETNWSMVIKLSNTLGFKVHGDPNKFESVVLERLALTQKGCKSIW